jgi:hypothetical protein
MPARMCRPGALTSRVILDLVLEHLFTPLQEPPMVRGAGISFKLTIIVECMPDIMIILLGKYKVRRGGGRAFRSVPPRFSIDAKSLKR